MVKLKFAVILGWTFDRTLTDRIFQFVKPYFVDRDHELIVLDDVREYKYLDDADGFVFISTELNGCIPSSLSSLIGHSQPTSFWYKPSALLVYSEDHYSAARAAKLLRSLCGDLGCGSVKKIFAIPEVKNKLNESGVPTSETIKTRLEKNFKTCLDQLLWTAAAFKEYKMEHPPTTVKVQK